MIDTQSPQNLFSAEIAECTTVGSAWASPARSIHPGGVRPLHPEVHHHHHHHFKRVPVSGVN